jgi:hypothetical protein
MEMKRYAIICPDGTEFEYWATPLTIAQRARAEKMAGPKADEVDQALHIFIAKAKEEDGSAMFTVGDFQDLRREMPADVLGSLMVQLLNPNMDEEEDLDPKQSVNSSKKTKD